MTEVYEYTSAPWRRGILNMSRGTKSKVVPREKGLPSQDESGSGDIKIADLFRMINERFDKQHKRFKEETDSRFEILILCFEDLSRPPRAYRASS